MTLLVLGLDGLDSRLVEHYGCETLPLSTSGKMETFSHMIDVPYTPEVWPTIATGLGPEEHGVTEEHQSEWDNPLVEFASRFTWTLPTPIRSRLGDIANDTLGAEYDIGTTDAETVFDHPRRVVYNWPGVTSSRRLRDVWNIATPEHGNTLEAFNWELRGIGAEMFGWLEEMSRHRLELAGVHVHTADLAGHFFSEEEANLGETYAWLDDRTADLLDAMGPDDDLLVVSDHGMATSWIDEPTGLDPGEHSWHAFSASTFDSRPEDVYDVREWITERIVPVADEDEEIEIPEEQLKDLGYI